MTTPPSRPHRGRDAFSGAEQNILKEFLDEFRKMNKEQRKELLMHKIYRLIKAAGQQLTAEEWRERKKANAVGHFNILIGLYLVSESQRMVL